LGVCCTEKVAELHLLCEKLGETLSGEGFNYYNEDRQEIGDEKVEERDEEGEEGERGERRSRRKGEERDSYSTANGRRDGRSLSPSDKAILAVASAYAEGSLLIAEGTYAKAIEFLTKTVSPSEQEVYLNPSWLPAQIALAHAVSAQLEEQEKQQEEEEEKETEETDQKRERNPYSCGASLSSSGAPSSSFFTPGIPPPSSRSQVRGIYRLLISIFKGDAKSHLYLANEILLMEEKAHFLSSRESCLAEEEEEEEKEEKEESLCATRMQRRSQRRRRIEEVCHYLRAALELDKRDVTILYQYARVLLHYYRHRSKEALDLIDRALVECTYTREAGPIRGRGDIIDLERDEEKNKKSQQNHVSLKERKEEEEREGDIENLDDEDHRENCHERGNPREEELLLHLCSFSADLLHALRGQALLELWRQQSDTVKSPGGEEEKEEEGLGGSNWTSFSQRNLGEEEEQPQQEDAFSPREERNRPKNERALLSSSSCASHEDRGDRERSSFLLLRASIEAFQKSLQLNPANLESQQLLSTALRLYGECPNGRGEREIT
ncbi:transmembrane protein, partial [Cystoisospora suis]